MAISVVNGFVCTSSCDVAKAASEMARVVVADFPRLMRYSAGRLPSSAAGEYWTLAGRSRDPGWGWMTMGAADEILGAFLHRRHGHRHVAMAGDERDRQRRTALEQAVLQLEAAHPVHPDVGDQAGDLARIEARQERLGRVEALDAVVLAFEQPLQRIAHRFVVVDDIDRAFFRDQAHAVAAAGAG